MWKTKIYYSVQIMPAVSPVLSQVNPIQTLEKIRPTERLNYYYPTSQLESTLLVYSTKSVYLLSICQYIPCLYYRYCRSKGTNPTAGTPTARSRSR